MELAWQTVVNGLVASGFYAVIAIGMSLVFGIMGVVNYAHGEFYMLGAYTVWLLYAVGHWPFFAAVVVAAVVVGLLGILVHLAFLRRVQGNMLGGLLICVGLIFILQVFVGQTWGVGLPKPVPLTFPQAVGIFGAILTGQRLVVFLAAILLLGLLFFFLGRVRLGRGLRACAQDSEAAALQGISINTSALVAIGIGLALAGVAGALMAPIMSVTPYMGGHVLLIAFIVVIVGGAGNLKGAILASLIFGFLITIVTTIADSTIAMIVSCLVMFAILSVRPQGLMGYVAK